MDSIFQVQAVEDRMPIGIPGGFVDTRPYETESYVNAAPLATQRATLTVDSHVADEVLSVVINSVTISVTNPASGGSTSTSAAALAAAINADARVSGQVVATPSTADVIIDSVWPGVAFTITEGETNLSLVATTANAVADPVPYGAAVIANVTSGTKGTLQATVSSVDYLTAKVVTATPVMPTSGSVTETITLSVTVNGRTYTATMDVTSATTVAAALDVLVPELNAQLPANTVAVVDSTTHATLTAEIAGLDFTVNGGSETETAWTITTTVEGASAVTRFRGVAVAQLAGPVAADGTAAYPAQSTMEVGKKGAWWVTVEEAVVEGDPVYFGVGAGHEGKWRKSVSGDDYIGLPEWRAHFETAAAAGGLAALALT